jgi:hypothetical protein
MSLSPSAIESLEKHDFGWKDLRCEAPGCQAPADGSIQGHYYCHKHLREELSRESQEEREKGYPVSASVREPLPLPPFWQVPPRYHGTRYLPSMRGMNA